MQSNSITDEDSLFHLGGVDSSRATFCLSRSEYNQRFTSAFSVVDNLSQISLAVLGTEDRAPRTTVSFNADIIFFTVLGAFFFPSLMVFFFFLNTKEIHIYISHMFFVAICLLISVYNSG